MSRATAPLTSTTFNGQKFVSVASDAELFENIEWRLKIYIIFL